MTRTIYGVDNNLTTALMRVNVEALARHGELHEARKYCEEALDANRRYYGPKDKRTLALMETAAAVYSAVGEHDRAWSLLIDAFNESLKTYGATDDNTVRCMVEISAELSYHQNTAESRKLVNEISSYVQPNDWVTRNELANSLATSDIADLRDGKRAIQLATEACRLTKFKQPHSLDTLAEAYAETENFDDAVKWSKAAIDLAKDDNLRKDLTTHLKGFEAKRPWRHKAGNQSKQQK